MIKDSANEHLGSFVLKFLLLSHLLWFHLHVLYSWCILDKKPQFLSKPNGRKRLSLLVSHRSEPRVFNEHWTQCALMCLHDIRDWREEPHSVLRSNLCSLMSLYLKKKKRYRSLCYTYSAPQTSRQLHNKPLCFYKNNILTQAHVRQSCSQIIYILLSKYQHVFSSMSRTVKSLLLDHISVFKTGARRHVEAQFSVCCECFSEA